MEVEDDGDGPDEPAELEGDAVFAATGFALGLADAKDREEGDHVGVVGEGEAHAAFLRAA